MTCHTAHPALTTGAADASGIAGVVTAGPAGTTLAAHTTLAALAAADSCDAGTAKPTLTAGPALATRITRVG
ncbi:hypothetical protein BST12_28490 [Mycobacterium angelicum]|uniref:Uncharacterized protein n=1 Tax=Mycobacterium angelicum TaxID=470074 RepID=A0A1W9Z707_MYCAN|nr:hypothetical protein BST12_28490 [Mycobacterium angelicum]